MPPLQARHHDELSEFAAEEHQVLTSTEASLAAEAAQWKAEAAAATAQLGEARQRLVDIDAALLQRDEQVGLVCKLWWKCCSGRHLCTSR